MKIKTIGQCKACKWWKRINYTEYGVCGYKNDDYDPTIYENYGCWYWCIMEFKENGSKMWSNYLYWIIGAITIIAIVLLIIGYTLSE